MGTRFAHAHATATAPSRSMGRPTSTTESSARDMYEAAQDWPTRAHVRKCAKRMARRAARRVAEALIAEGLDACGPVAPAPMFKCSSVPTFNVWRCGAEYVALTGSTEPACYASGMVDLPASQCNADDFMDTSFYDWCDKNEHYDTCGTLMAQATAELEEARAYERQLLAPGSILRRAA